MAGPEDRPDSVEDDVFGVVLPETTADEREPDADDRDRDDDERILRERPPHW